jgi:hypothetical protein
MTRMLWISLMALVVLWQPQPAEARWWGWLEKWSGPGPFRQVGPMLLLTGCFQDQAIPDDPNTRTADSILDWQKRLVFKPSPVAMNDAFHQRSEAFANAMEAARDKQRSVGPQSQVKVAAQVARTPEARPSGFLKALLANPSYVNELSPEASASTDLTIAGAQLLQIYKFTDAPPDAKPRERPKLRDIGPGHTHNRFICGYFDSGRYKAYEEDPRFPGLADLQARMYDLGPVARVHDGVDIGGGFGWVRFKGMGGAVDLKKMTFTPIRIILRPAIIALPDELRRKWRWAGIFTMYFKETYVKGKLEAADFDVQSSDWAENGELVRSFGINLDLLALLPGDWGIPLSKR